jgi:hypothetical protein
MRIVLLLFFLICFLNCQPQKDEKSNSKKELSQRINNIEDTALFISEEKKIVTEKIDIYDTINGFLIKRYYFDKSKTHPKIIEMAQGPDYIWSFNNTLVYGTRNQFENLKKISKSEYNSAKPLPYIVDSINLPIKKGNIFKII